MPEVCWLSTKSGSSNLAATILELRFGVVNNTSYHLRYNSKKNKSFISYLNDFICIYNIFKVWQCGGVVEWVPCSHVAHIYRGPRTESVHPPGGNPHQTSIVKQKYYFIDWLRFKSFFKIFF